MENEFRYNNNRSDYDMISELIGQFLLVAVLYDFDFSLLFADWWFRFGTRIRWAPETVHTYSGHSVVSGPRTTFRVQGIYNPYWHVVGGVYNGRVPCDECNLAGQVRDRSTTENI